MPTAYTCLVDAWKNPNEDERGVDVGQIRDLLQMSIAERAHEMVRVANLMAKARETALRGRAGDYAGWKTSATSELIDEGLVVSVASLDDIIDSKQTVNRPKDQLSLPYLESLRDELRRQMDA